MSDFGGRGGIAKYNRDLITAISATDPQNKITVLPRRIDDPKALQKTPTNVTHYAQSARGKVHYLREIVKLILSSQPFDLIICGHINLSPIAYLVAKLKRAKTCLLTYGIEVWEPPKKSWQRNVVAKMNAVVTISDFTKRKFEAWSKKAIQFLLPPAIELERFSPGEKNQDWMNKNALTGKQLITTLARLDASERYKGFDEIIDVLPSLLKHHPELVYVIAGDGDDRSRLEEKAKRLGLEGSVFFTGYIDEAEKLALFRSSDVFVMPGRGEGFGIVYLEARACGIPVIGSTLDASREALLDGKLGCIVNPDHPDEIKEAIIAAMNETDRTVPDDIHYFSIQRFVERTQQIVSQINDG